MATKANLSDVLNLLMQELLHLRTLEETNLQVNVQILAHLTGESPNDVYQRVANLRSSLSQHTIADLQHRFPEIFAALTNSDEI